MATTDIFRKAQELLQARVKPAFADGVHAVTGGIKQDLAINYPPASTPGNPPARRTGSLQDGIADDIRADGTLATVYSNRAFGSEDVPVWLEFGTKKMAPRPYMRPGMQSTSALIVDAMNHGGKLE